MTLWPLAAHANAPSGAVGTVMDMSATAAQDVNVRIEDVLDVTLLEAMVDAKYVKRQVHPDDPDLFIYNYTQMTQFAKEWNAVTLACRGLIVTKDGRVVARPLAKFFNLSEHPSEALPSGPVHVTDKLDGSLGIAYYGPDGLAIATRGSFASEQARHATQVLRTRYRDFSPVDGWTYLFEILYPGNRVVVDYAGVDDLFLLGAVDIATGRTVPFAHVKPTWPGPVVEEMPHVTLEDALSSPLRAGSEGVVIHFLEADMRVKVKSDEYVRLHRLVTDVSERRVWEALSAGEDLAQWLEAVPDECFSFVSTTRDRMLAEHRALVTDTRERFEALVNSLPGGWTRKDFAQRVADMKGYPMSRAMFSLLDGRSIDELAWRQIKPTEHVPMWGRSEDNS